MDKKSFEIYSKEHAQEEKFDYYICSVAGALFAYIGQSYTPHPLNTWENYPIPIALLALTLCFCIGLRVIHLSKRVTGINKDMLLKQEESEQILQLLSDKQISVFDNTQGPSATRDKLKLQFEDNKTAISCFRTEAYKAIAVAENLGRLRNGLLALGFLLILASKVLEPYLKSN